MEKGNPSLQLKLKKMAGVLNSIRIEKNRANKKLFLPGTISSGRNSFFTHRVVSITGTGNKGVHCAVVKSIVYFYEVMAIGLNKADVFMLLVIINLDRHLMFVMILKVQIPCQTLSE